VWAAQIVYVTLVRTSRLRRKRARRSGRLTRVHRYRCLLVAVKAAEWHNQGPFYAREQSRAHGGAPGDRDNE